MREHPAAVEGQIVHAALDRLTRWSGRSGRPPIGTATFRAVVAESGFFDGIARAVTAANQSARVHPRSGPLFVIRTSPQELANRAVRLFKEQYKPQASTGPHRTVAQASTGASVASLPSVLANQGALSEVRLVDPKLPFKGTIDLLVQEREGVVVVDHKTGVPKPAHEVQVKRYAALWWRCTGVRPVRAVLQYLNGKTEFGLTEADVLKAERDLVSSITEAEQALTDTPARAKTSGDCGRCPVRARCDEGWARCQTDPPRAKTADIEVCVSRAPVATGFSASAGKREVHVVYEVEVGATLRASEPGERLRLVDAVPSDDGKTFEVRPWTEVFQMGHL